MPESDTRKSVTDFDGKVDAIRKKNCGYYRRWRDTGEERLREHTDQLYGALLSYEGKPGEYQLAYIDALKRELNDVSNDFVGLLVKDLPALNDQLKAKGQPPISSPPEKLTLSDEPMPTG